MNEKETHPLTKPIQTILFDFDGTLFDTNELIVRTFQHVLDKYHPGEYTEEDILPFLGPPLIDTFKKINPENYEELVAEYRRWNIEHHDDYAKEFDGVSDTLFALKERGLDLAVVSTKRRDVLEKGINQLRGRYTFSEVISLDDVEHAKPHPEPLQKAMTALGADPETTIMVGDNSHDIEGGQNAGIRTVGVKWSLKGEEFLRQFNPDYMIDDIRDILTIVDEANA